MAPAKKLDDWPSTPSVVSPAEREVMVMVLSLREVQQPMNGRQRHVHRVELIVADRTGGRPVGAGDHADHGEGLIPDANLGADRIDAVPNRLLVCHRSEHDHLVAAFELALGEKAAVLPDPAPPNALEVRFCAVEAREPSAISATTRADSCTPADTYCTPGTSDRMASASARVSVAAAPKPGGRIAEPLTRRRVIVLLHRDRLRGDCESNSVYRVGGGNGAVRA